MGTGVLRLASERASARWAKLQGRIHLYRARSQGTYFNNPKFDSPFGL